MKNHMPQTPQTADDPPNTQDQPAKGIPDVFPALFFGAQMFNSPRLRPIKGDK